MPINPITQNQYSNEDAAALCAFVLHRLTFEVFEILFPCTCDEDVLKKFSEIFCVEMSEVDSIFRSISVHVDDTSTANLPEHLEDMSQYLRKVSDQGVMDAAFELLECTWLPDLGKIWEECSVGLAAESDVAEVQIPSVIADRIAAYLSEKYGYNIDDVSPTALHITSKTKKQKSIISFAVLSKLRHILPHLNAIKQYTEKARLVLGALAPLLPGDVAQKKKGQTTYEYIKDGKFDETRLHAEVNNLFKNEYTTDRFIRAIRDQEWSGIPKSIFRTEKDILKAVCQNKLEIENEKTGYVENLIQYLIDSGDQLLEMPSTQSDETSASRSIQPDLDRNIIFFGAPGTGKSFAAKSYAGSCHLERVVFSADYQNSDFIGYLQPQPDPEHGVTYKFESGPFIRALKKAFEKKDQPVVLLIEEINRGNAPAIFGELFQLLDRNASGESEYRVSVAPSVLSELSDISEFVSAQQVWLPSNLFIVGTMNSSDQGVFPLDTAFKRRFNFEYVSVDFDAHHTKPDFVDPKINVGGALVSWQIFGKAINETLLDTRTPEDKLLGPFFLSPSELSKPNLDTLIVQKVCFYLWEDVLRHEDKKSIFDENLRSFSDLQNKFKARENIFSDSVLNYISEFSPANAEASDEGRIDSAD